MILSTIFTALSGLGIFLFGMFFLESALKDAGGSKLKKIVKSFTSSIPKAILTGGVVTAILQSSSIVSLMALSFVGAELMSLGSAIGVIFGANIGTTATAWIVAYLGFKVKIAEFALIMVGVGGLLSVFASSSKKIEPLGRLLIGFGMLFMGLEQMKEGTDIISQNFDIASISAYGIFTMFLVGFLLTAIIQSSSATTAITLSALYSGIIGFDAAAGVMIGANLGTTATAVIGAIGGSSNKKRAAVAHFLFNVLSALLAFLLFSYMIEASLYVFSAKDEATMALALFHTFFNTLGVLVFAPFIPLLQKYLEKLFVEKEESVTKYIDPTHVDMIDISLESALNETLHYLKRALKFSIVIFDLNPDDVMKTKKKAKEIIVSKSVPIDSNYLKQYTLLKKHEILIAEYLAKVSEQNLAKEDVKFLNKLSDALREISYAAKAIKDIKLNLDKFSEDDEGYLYQVYLKEKELAIKIFRNITLILTGDEEGAKKLAKSFVEIKGSNPTNIEIANLIKEKKLKEDEMSSLMHTNRSLLNSADSIFKSALILTNLKKEEA